MCKYNRTPFTARPVLSSFNQWSSIIRSLLCLKHLKFATFIKLSFYLLHFCSNGPHKHWNEVQKSFNLSNTINNKLLNNEKRNIFHFVNKMTNSRHRGIKDVTEILINLVNKMAASTWSGLLSSALLFWLTHNENESKSVPILVVLN